MGDKTTVELRIAAGEDHYNRTQSADVTTKNNESAVAFVNPWMNIMFSVSILCALIYVIFPVSTSISTNYWAYYMGKQQWWSLFGTAGFIEIAETCLPGAPVHTYVYSYMFGWLIPASLRVVAYLCGLEQSVVFDTLCVTTSIIAVLVFYGYWQASTGRAEDSMQRFRLSASDQGVTHDMFSATLDIDDPEAQGRSSSMAHMSQSKAAADSRTGSVAGAGFMSRNRAMWVKTLRRFRDEAQEVLVEQQARRRSCGGRSIRSSTASVASVHVPFSAAVSDEESASATNPMQRSSNSSVASSVASSVNSSTGRFDDAMSMTAEVDEREHYEDAEMQLLQFEQHSLIARFFCSCGWHRLLPRFWYPFFGELPGAHVTSNNRPLHFALTIAYCIGWILVFFILTIFTFAFRLSASASSRVRWFFLFVLAATICKVCMKRLGLLLDRGKVGTCSMYFVSELMCTLFYYTFYRMLFEDFVGWDVFAFVQLFHFSAEWCMYVLRATRIFYDFVKDTPYLGPLRGVFVMSGLSHRDWQIFLSLDFALRVAVTFYSVPGFVLLFIATDVVPWISSALKPISLVTFQFVLGQIAICLLLEVVNAWIMYRFFFRVNDLRVNKYAFVCFSKLRFAWSALRSARVCS